MRSFDELPDRDAAPALLEELNERRPLPKAPAFRLPLVLYGRGEEAVWARRHLSCLGVPIAFTMDHIVDGTVDDSEWSGIETGTPADAEDALKEEALVVVATSDRPYGSVAGRLAEDGWQAIAPFSDFAEACSDTLPAAGGWSARWQNKKDFARFLFVMQNWADDRSRADHLRVAAWRMRRAEWIFEDAPVQDRDRFMVSEVVEALRHDERIVDVGSFHGAGFMRIARRPAHQFAHVVAIEPDATNRAILEAEVIGCGSEFSSRVTVLSDVVGATAGPVPFRDGLGPWSQCTEGDGEERQTVTLDELGLDPTMLLIDVPGGGHAALEGAAETLGRYRPIVAVETSHDADGLWKIADHLMTAVDDYAFLMRSHGWCGMRSVVYAIPNERRRAT